MDDREWLTGAIERNCDALLRVAAVLLALIRAPGGGMRNMLPRQLYFHVLRILRPAESAVRRLVVLQEMQLEIAPAACPANRPALPARQHSAGARNNAKAAPAPAFQLFDPFKPLPHDPWIADDGKAGPFALPGYPCSPPGEPRDAAQLCRRLWALIAALDDLPAQARRLARWRLKRERPRRFSSLRPGWPPGHRKRPSHEVDEILRECRRLVAWAQSPPQNR